MDEGTERVLEAARELLDDGGSEPFSLEAVARRAGVARMTLYNRFGSKAGLLEALFDSIAARGEFARRRDVFAEPDPVAALDAFVALFGRFWTAKRGAHRKLSAAAAGDAELNAAIAARNERRRQATRELVRRLAGHRDRTIGDEELVQALFVLLSFDTFNSLAGPDRMPIDVVPLVQEMARRIAGVHPTPPG